MKARYVAAVERLAGSALFDLKGPQAALADWAAELPAFPQGPNRRIAAGGAMLCHVGPGRWLLRAALADEAAWEAALRPAQAPPKISVVRVSDTMVFFRVTGPDADQVMAVGCPLDLHPSVFGEEAVSFTEFFGLRALVMRCKRGFEVAVEQSFGPMLGDYLGRVLG